MHCMLVAYLYLCFIQSLHFADDISVSSDDISVSSMDECEKNDSVIVTKKTLSSEDREKLQIRVEGLQKLSTTLHIVEENVLANQLKQECGKWNNICFITYNSL